MSCREQRSRCDFSSLKRVIGSGIRVSVGASECSDMMYGGVVDGNLWYDDGDGESVTDQGRKSDSAAQQGAIEGHLSSMTIGEVTF